MDGQSLRHHVYECGSGYISPGPSLSFFTIPLQSWGVYFVIVLTANWPFKLFEVVLCGNEHKIPHAFILFFNDMIIRFRM